MKDIRAAIRRILLDDAAVSALVGGSRVYPSILPQGQTLASIVYTLRTEDTDYHLAGPSNLVSARYQVDAWAQTADAAVQLGDAAHDALSGYRGVVAFGSNSPQTQITIHGIFSDFGGDDYDATAKLHNRRRDFFVKFAEF